MKKVANVLVVIAVLLVIAGSVFCYQGFDKKDNYYSSDYSSLNKNAYVGGDAYNYIINGTYFTGYIVLGSALYVCSAMFLCTGLLLKKTKQEEFIPESTQETQEEAV